MSIKVTNWVWAMSKSRNGARLVMLAIADRADDNGLAWPSVEDIADRTRLTPRAVRKCTKELVELGELKVENGGGRHRSNRYLVVPKPGTLDRVTDGKPGTLDRVSSEETLNSATETLNSEHETLNSATGNPVQSSPEPPLEPPTEPSENPPARRREPSPAEALLDKWWDQYGHTTAQGKHSIRRAITDALNNGIEPGELWNALDRIGALSKPITGGTLQFAFSELRSPARPGSNVVHLPTGRTLTGTDARVAGWAALTAELEAKEQQR